MEDYTNVEKYSEIKENKVPGNKINGIAEKRRAGLVKPALMFNDKRVGYTRTYIFFLSIQYPTSQQISITVSAKASEPQAPGNTF